MPSSSWGRLAVPAPLLALLVLLAVASVSAVVLPPLGLPGPAGAVAGLAMLVACATGVFLLARRGLTGPRAARRPWLMLAGGGAGLAVWSVVVEPRLVDGSPARGTHLLLLALAGVGLWLLPAPEQSRRGLLRTALDAAAAGFAVAIPSGFLIVPGGWRHVLAGSGSGLHPVADVLLVAVAVAVVARSRRAGGLAIAPVVALSLGAVLVAISDLLGQDDRSRATTQAVLVLAVSLWSLAAVLPGDGPEPDVEVVWR